LKKLFKMKSPKISAIYFSDGRLIAPNTELAARILSDADCAGTLNNVYIKRGNFYYEIMLMTFDSATNGSEGATAVVRPGLILVKKIDFESINEMKEILSTDQSDFFYDLKGRREIPK
jgi:hypothetical protein